MKLGCDILYIVEEDMGRKTRERRIWEERQGRGGHRKKDKGEEDMGRKTRERKTWEERQGRGGRGGKERYE